MLIASRRGPYPHQDEGKEVCRLFHRLRCITIENLYEQRKAIFTVHEHVPTKHWGNTRRFILGAILVYQLALLYRLEASPCEQASRRS